MAIQTAKIDFNQSGTPVASAFDDVYFSNTDGLEETRYVFLANNALPQRWNQSQQEDFVIAETGFGTGLNFLASWEAFERFVSENPASPLRRLYFISTEKFPLALADLETALGRWPQLEKFTTELLKRYPHLSEGCHRLKFHAKDYQIILDLWLGDLHQLLPEIDSPADGLVDAWFLDGFAPSKNPDMWTEALFSQMARLGKPGCTFATFTAAGFVRRGLQQAGFNVEKRKGFGHKRDMSAGWLAVRPVRADPSPWYQRQGSGHRHVTVIGAGLAGASLCHALCHHGFQVTLYSRGVADGASGNHQGGFYPQLHSQMNLSSRLMAQAFGFARRAYDSLQQEGFHFSEGRCGVLQLAFNDSLLKKQAKLIAQGDWPESLIHAVDQAEARRLAGLPLPWPGLFIAQGGWIEPAELVRAMLASCGEALTLVSDRHLTSLEQTNPGWRLTWQDNSQCTTELLVLCPGAEAVALPLLQSLPLRPVRGQVEHIPACPPASKLSTVLCHKGYMTPVHSGFQALGSTYVKQDLSRDYRAEEQQINLQTHRQALAHVDWIENLQGSGQGRASVRLGTPDHLPLLGAMPDIPQQREDYQSLNSGKGGRDYPAPANLEGLFLFMGLGSRGLCTAPLLGEALACQLAGKPMPLERSTLAALSPNRFLIRQLRKQG